MLARSELRLATAPKVPMPGMPPDGVIATPARSVLWLLCLCPISVNSLFLIFATVWLGIRLCVCPVPYYNMHGYSGNAAWYLVFQWDCAQVNQVGKFDYDN